MKTNLRAIVFEEDEVLANGLQEILCELGYECSCIGDLGMAVPKANVGNYDIAVVDVNFCDDMAYALLDILKRRHIDIILVEGHSRCAVRSPYDREVTVHKPFHASSLRAAIATVARSRKALISQ